MSSRLGQQLLRAKSNTENSGLFTLYFSYFFYLLFDCSMANFWLLLSKQSQSPNVNHCIWDINFWPRVGLGGVRSLYLTECPVSFDHNAITPQIAQNTLPRFKPSFSKMLKCPQYPKKGIAWHCVVFRLAKYLLDAKCRVQNFSFLLINQWRKVPGSTVSLNWGNVPNTPKGI